MELQARESTFRHNREVAQKDAALEAKDAELRQKDAEIRDATMQMEQFKAASGYLA